ncbi:MAG: hypothetical protein RSA24_06620, partial [Clostridia bacterium]
LLPLFLLKKSKRKITGISVTPAMINLSPLKEIASRNSVPCLCNENANPQIIEAVRSIKVPAEELDFVEILFITIEYYI